MPVRCKRKNLFDPVRYDGNLENDVMLSEGNTKIARLITIQTIEKNWNRFIKDQKEIMNMFDHHGITRLDNVPYSLYGSSSINESIYDEPYKLWLKDTEVVITNKHIYLKDSSNEEQEINYDNLKVLTELSF